MFTIEQIMHAHSKVRSGADFPTYIQDLKKLGVTNYETFVSDGHADFYGVNNFKATSPAKYAGLKIAEMSDAAKFKADLAAHQHGKTNYPTFCNDAAKSGIERWVVSLNGMTCTYYDRAGTTILEERIPQ